jgi:chromosome segregation ATPase
MKAAIVLLLICTLGLGVALLVVHNKRVQIEKVKETTTSNLNEVSNTLEQTRAKLEEQEQVAMKLETNLLIRGQELSSVSNNYLNIKAELAKTQKDMQAAAEAARAAIEQKDAQISQLTSRTNEMTRKMDDLSTSIGNLSKQIGDTERKLAASEGDREFLLKELKRLQTEKSELEKQFNDLSLLRTQVAKLKEELSVARRLEWIRMGIYGLQEQKGAQRLMVGAQPPGARSNFNLNVELKQDGGATVVQPRQTNATSLPPPR